MRVPRYKRTAFISVMGILLLCVPTIVSAQGTCCPTDNGIAVEISPQPPCVTYGSSRQKEIDKLRIHALNGNYEVVVFLIFSDNGMGVYVPSQEQNTETKAYFEYSDLRSIIASTKGITKIEYYHTHPLQSLSHPDMDFKKESEIGPLRGRRELLSPLPPSTTDLFTLVVAEEELGHDNASLIEHHVVEPTGIWKMKGKSSSGDLYSEVQTTLRQYLAAKKIYEDKGEGVATEAELDDYVDKQVKWETFTWGHKGCKLIWEVQEKIFALNGSSDRKAKKALVTKYIRRTKNAGFVVSYEPFKK